MRAPDSPPNAAQAIDCIIQNLVGSLAEGRIDLEPGLAKSGAKSDCEKARAYARYFKLSENWPAWETEARAFVDNNWCLISAVARAVLRQPFQGQKKRLPGGRVRRLASSRLYRLAAIIRITRGCRPTKQ